MRECYIVGTIARMHNAVSTVPFRIHSIDVFRSVTMLLMVFVNDLSAGVPAWLLHAEAAEDAMGFSDVIFPAFLFIVGLSVPLAIENRLKRGDTAIKLIAYIAVRTFALIVMGFFHVNLEHYHESALLPKPVWQILITVSFFMIWLDYPRNMASSKKQILSMCGAVMLMTLALLYKTSDAAGPFAMKPYWGGILGLISWAYGVAALAYVLLRGRITLLIIMAILLFQYNYAVHAQNNVPTAFPIGDGSSIALAMAGVAASVLYTRAGTDKRMIFIILTGLVALAAIAIGFFVREHTGGISKIRSTPSWVLICTGISMIAFVVFIHLADNLGKVNWFSFIRPAGTSTLTCYLLPYIVYALFTLVSFRYPGLLRSGLPAVVKSLVFAFVIVWLTGFLERRRLRLKV